MEVKEHVHEFEPAYEMRRGWALDCVHCPLRIPIEQVNSRLNATERLSAKGARAIINVFPVDALIEYANILEGK